MQRVRLSTRIHHNPVFFTFSTINNCKAAIAMQPKFNQRALLHALKYEGLALSRSHAATVRNQLLRVKEQGAEQSCDRPAGQPNLLD
jgi:hypothetical protein